MKELNFIVTINCLTTEQTKRIYEKCSGTISYINANIEYDMINHDVIIYVPVASNLMPAIIYNENPDSPFNISKDIGIEINIEYVGVGDAANILRKIAGIIRMQFHSNDDNHYKCGNIIINDYDDPNSLTVYVNNRLGIEPVLMFLPLQ